MDLSAQDIEACVLPHYAGLDGATVAPFGAGLINQTYLVSRGPARFILQRLSPIFSAAINGNIEAVTRRLAEQGMVTPRVLPAREGQLAIDLREKGLWRLQTFVDGASFDVVQSPAQARAAADQLLVKPSGPDHAGLPLYGQVRFQCNGHAAQALRVVAAALLGQVARHLP